MMRGRIGHAATLLPDGEVLVTGGETIVPIPNGANFNASSTAEIYNPVTGKWRLTGAMNQERSSHTATLLPDGKVLVAGGATNSVVHLSSAELYDPKSEQWSNTASMKFIRGSHTATLLTNGLVLVAGGWNEDHNFRFDAELYDATAGKWTTTGEMPFESRFFYSAALLTNGLVLLTARSGSYDWEVTNAWEVSKLLFDPGNGRWTAVGPRRPHFVSSTNLDRALTILPESGSQFLACQQVYLSVESADRFGVTNIQLFQDGVRIAVGEQSPMRFTITNQSAGSYTLFARADFANGLASTSSAVNITFRESGPEVFLAPGPTEFISERHIKSSPAILLASVVGVNPDSLTNLTLNGVPQPLQTGNFVLRPPLAEGRNVFVLVAKDKQGRSAHATTEVFLNTSLPSIAIKEPADGASINAMCVDVRGTFTAKSLKHITVNQMPAVITDTSFEARNVFLPGGTNTISAIAEDMAGNSGTNTIMIIGPTDTNIAQTLPVQIKTTPSGGFAPLTVTFNVEAHVPGAVQKVFYDFDGDGSYDQTNPDVKSVTHIYKTDGEYFPVVTIQTGVGRFSSVRSLDWLFSAVRICVQRPPVLVRELKVTDPVDLQCTKEGNLYVLSRKLAALTEFDATGKRVRSVLGMGSAPQGLCVDDQGNVYVAMTGDNKVWKFRPTTDSFEPDKGFGASGYVGSISSTPGTNHSEFDRPFDIAILKESSHDPGLQFVDTIWVSDLGNHRIQKFTRTGEFVGSFGRKGTNRFEFDGPKGIYCDGIATVCIVDSGNNRVCECADFGPVASSGQSGTALAEFQAPVNICLSERGICVADTGNNRIQICDAAVHWHGSQLSPFRPRVAVSKEFGLKQPNAVAWVNDLLEDRVYVADTGNDRVLLIRFPADTPEAAWNAMKERLLKGDIDGAITYFASQDAEKYRETYLAIGTNALAKTISEIPPIKPVEIKHGTAQYRFNQMVQGQLLTFPIEFVKENGKWKIMEY